MIRRILLVVASTVVLAGMLFPLWWLVVSSLSPSGGIADLTRIWPSEATLSTIADVVVSSGFLRASLNSIIVAFVVCGGNVLFGLTVGYALARRRFPGHRLLFLSVVAVLALPVHATMIPLFMEMLSLGIVDTFAALTLPWLVMPLSVFLMKQYLELLPEELEAAARVDGAGEWAVLVRIVAPLAKPALAVVVIQTFLVNWNAFLFPFLLTDSESMRTLPVALALFAGYQGMDWPRLAAASLVASLPVIVVFLAFQRHIVSGLTAGALRQ
jgi:multiple sugar transport system permease protein